MKMIKFGTRIGSFNGTLIPFTGISLCTQFMFSVLI